MISRELEAEILRLYHAEHWRIGTLARQLNIHHDTVRRVLMQAGIPAAAQSTRGSIADPFVPFIQDTLARYPSLRASRLYQMVRERGYPGRPDHFRAIVARYRPRPAAQALSAAAHFAGGPEPVRLGALRQVRHRPSAATADGLRDGAVVLAAPVPALLSGSGDERLPRWPCSRLQRLRVGSPYRPV